MPTPLEWAFTYDDQVVLVTGGTRGIGAGIARRFLAEGARVAVTARREPETLPEHEGACAWFVAADLRDPDQAAAAVDAVVEREGRLDIVVNNAGGSPPADSATASPRFSSAIVDLNLMAPLHVAQAANRVMQGQPDGGLILNIGSVSGKRPSPGTAAYGAAKAGLANLTTTLAVEWAPKVRVNMITAGLVLTEEAHLHYGDDEGIAAVASTVPLGRMATPDDVADACMLLSSPLAGYVTGADLAVHGGGERPAFLGAANVEERPGDPGGAGGAPSG